MKLFKKAPRPQPRPTPRRCPEPGVDGHRCALPADGHTMHRCAHGDCEWGHR